MALVGCEERRQAWQKLAPHAPDGLFSVLNLNAAAGGRAHITSAGQFFGTAEKLRELLKPLANAGTPTRFTVATRSYMDAQEMWAGCGGTLAECHLPPQESRARRPSRRKSSFANTPLTSAGIDAMLHQIEARITTGTGSGIILLDSYGGAINRVKKDCDGLCPSRCAVLDAVPRVLGCRGRGRSRACAG